MAIDKRLDDERASRYDKMKQKLTEKKPIPLSNTTLDLILGGHEELLGIFPNDIINIVGDSGSGKTALYTQMIYEIMGYINAGLSEEYSSCSHSVMDGEGGNKFRTEEMFGYELQKCDKATTIEDVCSELLLGFKENTTLNKRRTNGKNLNIVVIDSLDSFPSKKTIAREEDRMKAYDKDKEFGKDTFGLEKHNFVSNTMMPIVVPALQGADTLLIIVSQTREKMNVSFGSTLKVTGGTALQFYCTYRLLIAESEELRKPTEDGDKPIGKLLKFKTLKVRSSKPYRTCFNVYFNELGFDSVLSDIIYVYGLTTDTGKLKNDADSRNLSWAEEGKEYPERNKLNLYNFLAEIGTIEGLKKTTSKAKMEELIESSEDLTAKALEVFGSGMNPYDFRDYIIENDLVDALKRKALDKWNRVEGSLAIKRHKKW